jgi:hypothetical protein
MPGPEVFVFKDSEYLHRPKIPNLEHSMCPHDNQKVSGFAFSD